MEGKTQASLVNKPTTIIEKEDDESSVGFSESVLRDASKFSKMTGKQQQIQTKIYLNNDPKQQIDEKSEGLSMSSSEFASPGSHENTQQKVMLEKLKKQGFDGSGEIEPNSHISSLSKGSLSSEQEDTKAQEQQADKFNSEE